MSTPDPNLLERAVAEWSQGRYYEAHELLEDFADSVEDDDAEQAIALALIHVAAAIHKHVERVTPEGVPGKLERALVELEQAPRIWRGIDLLRLKGEIAAMLEALRSGRTVSALPKL
jgi:hypothetical protein